ncbi:hypothetical protein [Mammaliicoccus sciuri]|uniref:hypothetical protein n=1 Tax=Mammaliicoccus sciuri TaxID=1296 RepID=UPI0019534E0E|nr:hypothetical protein [Mammaliicoccus sciuri]MCJ1764983.1 hypothetical protein [Mammaliicoccus sciuri]MCJ1774003.1 hypothetical protein [Mammaliicoccus sciuri]
MDNIFIILSIKEGWSTLLSAILGAILGSSITSTINYYNSKRQLLNDLDSKSEFRKRLYDVASNPTPCMKDVLTIRTSLRFIKKNTKNNTQEDFDIITNDIIDFCDTIENEYYNSLYKKNFKLTNKDTKILQLYTRYLLKHHWEKNQVKLFGSALWEGQNLGYINELKYEIQKIESQYLKN